MTAFPLTRGTVHDTTPKRRWIAKACLSAPVTASYLLVLTATTAVLSTSSARRDNQLLLSVSTNLHQLAHDPVRVLIASAFWTSGWWELALWTALFAAILAQVERRVGSRRMTMTFVSGHVGATLLVATGLWIGTRLDAVNPADILALDVGASYGFFAVAPLAAYLLAPRHRTTYLALITGYVVATAAFFHTFTDFGHLTAVAIGLACYPLVRNPRRVTSTHSQQPLPPTTPNSQRVLAAWDQRSNPRTRPATELFSRRASSPGRFRSSDRHFVS